MHTTQPMWFAVELVTSASTEYCQWEKFNASCRGTDDVILMLSGRYGRMRFGRCMREDHGSVGCSANVLAYLDRQCSGRRHCQLPVPDAVLHAMHRCPKEIMSYLEASYVCVTGKHGASLTATCFNQTLLSTNKTQHQPTCLRQTSDRVFTRDAMQKRAYSRHAVSVRPSVCHVRGSSCQNE